ncbi:adhesion G protein-coupled receptor L3-like [Acanthaster planci]|uniref:Adhesion G protein-coupled receptor L3-like n=1 Tax=Acanthaster planci TaxID=133434 RepID=A0A8B7Y8U2_ACAPL|nr:adhesion G protein-coupled receptor L3-like [Acanthaster planci]
MPLNSIAYANSKRIDSNSYVRDAYMGGTLSLDIPDFQSEHVGVYLCVINWWSAVANVTLEGPEALAATTSAPTTSAPTTSAPTTSAPTTSAPTTSAPTTSAPTTSAPTTSAPTTSAPTTLAQMATQLSTSLHTSPKLSSAPQTDPSGTVHTFSPGPSTLQSGVMPSSAPTPAEPITAGEETTPATSPSVEGGKTTATTGTKDKLSHTEGPLTTDALPTVTPSWCALGDVHTLQEAIACGKTSRIDVEPGKLTDDKKVELVNFLKFVVSQPTHQELKTYSETAAVTKTVLMVFTKLTDADQNLSVQEEAEIVADTEEALKVLAGTLLPKTCATLGYDGSSVSLCNSPTLSLLSGYTFTHQVPISYDDSGDVITTFEESAEFDLSKMDLDAKNVSAVILRKMRPSYMIDQIKFWESTDNLQAPNETWIQLNSALLTLSLFVQGNRTSVPVTFSLYHLENLKGESRTGESATVNISKNSICAFVDDKDDQNVQWSAYGCKAVSPRSTNEHTYCSCNHSTNFAVLMQVKSYEISHADSLALTWITYIGCSTSMVMLVLMLAVFLYLGRMLRSDRSFIHTNLSVAILVAQILFIAGIDRTENRGICKAIALLLHFCYLSVFAWMLVEGVHLYMKVVKVYGSENIKMYPYLFIGWGIPLVITLISFGASNDGYGTGNSCWLDTSSGLIWAFVAPALLVIMINLIVLAMVVRIVIKSAHLRQEKKYDHIKAGIKGALTLLPLLGLTWVFGLLAVNSATILFQYLFTIFNSFQGLFIFLINCVFNSEVKTAFVRKREKQKLAHERDTLEHSMSFVYSSKKATSADNSSNTRHQPADEHTRKEQYTDLTSLRSDSPSSRPGSGTALLDVTQRKHLKRPHSGKVSPMPIKDVDDLETI